MQEYQHLSGFFLARETTTTTTTVRRIKKERSKKLATSLSTTPEAETETKKKSRRMGEKQRENYKRGSKYYVSTEKRIGNSGEWGTRRHVEARIVGSCSTETIH